MLLFSKKKKGEKSKKDKKKKKKEEPVVSEESIKTIPQKYYNVRGPVLAEGVPRENGASHASASTIGALASDWRRERLSGYAGKSCLRGAMRSG